MQALILPNSTNRLKIVFSVVYIMAGFLIMLLPLLLIIKIFFLISISLGCYFNLFYHHSAGIRLQKIDDTLWEIEFASGKLIRGNLQGSSISTSLFCVIIVKSPHRWIATKLIVVNDALPSLQYHRLRLQLKGLLP